MKDLIPGGLSDNKSDKMFPKKELAKGIKVESEHTSSKAVAKEIAKDHLMEDKKYYDKLETIEKKAFWEGFCKQAAAPSMANLNKKLKRATKLKPKAEAEAASSGFRNLLDKAKNLSPKAKAAIGVGTVGALAGGAYLAKKDKKDK